MHNLKMRLVSLPLLLCSLGLLAGADRGDLPFDDPDGFFQKHHPPTSINNFGLFTIENTHAYLRSNEGFFKSFFKVTVKSGLSCKPLAQVKALTNEDLVACSSVRPGDEELRAYLACDDRGFIVKTTVLHKSSSLYGGNKIVYSRFPMKTSYTKAEIERLFHTNEINDTNLMDPEYVGLYFDGKTRDIHWYGRILFAMSNSDSFYDNLESGDLVTHFVKLASEPEYAPVLFFDLKAQDKRFGNMGINMEFFITKREEFPYLTSTLRVRTFPFEQVLNFEAKIRQSRKRENTEAYDTELSALLNSISNLIPGFSLKHVIMNDDRQNGEDEMQFCSEGFCIAMDSTWVPGDFCRNLRMYYVDKKSNGDGTFNFTTFSPVLLGYRETEGRSHNALKLVIPKEIVPVYHISGIEYRDNSDLMPPREEL